MLIQQSTWYDRVVMDIYIQQLTAQRQNFRRIMKTRLLPASSPQKITQIHADNARRTPHNNLENISCVEIEKRDFSYFMSGFRIFE